MALYTVITIQVDLLFSAVDKSHDKLQGFGKVPQSIYGDVGGCVTSNTIYISYNCKNGKNEQQIENPRVFQTRFSRANISYMENDTHQLINNAVNGLLRSLRPFKAYTLSLRGRKSLLILYTGITASIFLESDCNHSLYLLQITQ